jgi:hypothetical protein
MKNKILFLLVLLIVGLVADADAQCAMCKASAEANLKIGGGDPKGLNAGILYMLVMPYIIVGCIGYWWWKNRKSDTQTKVQLEDQFGERH